MKHARGTPVPQMTNETMRIEWASDGWVERMEAETTPPEAAATTDETMGRRKVAAMLCGVWVWRVKLGGLVRDALCNLAEDG